MMILWSLTFEKSAKNRPRVSHSTFGPSGAMRSSVMLLETGRLLADHPGPPRNPHAFP